VCKDSNWDYSGLDSLESRTPKPPQFLSDLCCELFKWTRTVTKRYGQFPEGYTEWTLAGHLAIAADRCEYLPLQEAMGLSSESKDKSVDERSRRPDLYLASADERDRPSVFFECKKDWAWLPPNGHKIKVMGKIEEANNQLQKIASIADRDEWPAGYLCCALGLIILMDWKSDNDVWQKRGYDKAWRDLKGKFEETLCKSRVKLREYGRVYHCCYRMPHALVAGTQHEYAEKNGKNEIPIGMFWVFSVRLQEEIAI